MKDRQPLKALGESLIEADSLGGWLIAAALAALFLGVPLLVARKAIEQGEVAVAISLALAVTVFGLAVGRDLYRRELSRSSAGALLLWLAAVLGARWQLP
jgi:hypothetical protein